MNHTVFSGIIQMRTYDLVFVVPKKFIIKSRADLMTSRRCEVCLRGLCFFMFVLLLFFFFFFLKTRREISYL